MNATKPMTFADAVRYLNRKKIETVGYQGEQHTGWHRFTTVRGTTIDVRRNPTTGKIETR
jgi:hypothetical protein